MLEKIINRLFEMIEPKIKEWMIEAYRQGAEDENRRIIMVYNWGIEKGMMDTYAKMGLVDISKEEFDKLTEEEAES